MSDPSPYSRTRSPETISVRAPEGWAWLAAVAIAVMGAYGLYRGVTGVQSGGSSLLPTPHAGGIVAPVDAANAAPMAKDAQWSTLSGPPVTVPPPVKVAKAAPLPVPDEDAPPAAAPDGQ